MCFDFLFFLGGDKFIETEMCFDFLFFWGGDKFIEPEMCFDFLFFLRGDKFIEPEICVLIFSTFMSERVITLRRTERDMVKNVHRVSCKVPVILLRF